MKPNPDHHSEILLLGVIAIGVCMLAAFSIWRNAAGEAAAWSAILMAIVNSIKERWQNRTIDTMGKQLGASVPPAEGPTGAPGDPIHTTEEKKP